MRPVRTWLTLLLAVASSAGCTTTQASPPPIERPKPIASEPSLEHTPLDPALVRVEPEPRTVGDLFILDLYTFFHAKDYATYRIEFPSELPVGDAVRESEPQTVAHLLVPERPGPHPVVVVFPILAGSHVVSEAFAKVLVNRGYAVLRLERPRLDLSEATRWDEPAQAFRSAILAARRLLDWAVTEPRLDSTRIATAGISLGGMLACTLHGVDPRVTAGAYLMAGGGVAEILHDSTERPVRAFRDHLIARDGVTDREAFLARMRPLTDAVDPLRHATRIDPATALLSSGRFDHVIPPERSEALWHALGEPRWIHLPVGHYQLLPFFWWSAHRAADHFDEVLRK